MTKKDFWIQMLGSEQAYLDAVNHVHREFLDLCYWAGADAVGTPQEEDIANHAVIALAWTEDSDAHWRRLATYTLTALDSRGDLTPDEQRIRAIAESVYRAEQIVARRLGRDLYPKDSEDSLRRARAELQLQPPTTTVN
jgi:hypothetical protein